MTFKVGVTEGLVRTKHAHDTEQAYVYRRDNDLRPIRVEGWQGYAHHARMDLTRKQAKELAILLIEAVAVDDV